MSDAELVNMSVAEMVKMRKRKLSMTPTSAYTVDSISSTLSEAPSSNALDNSPEGRADNSCKKPKLSPAVKQKTPPAKVKKKTPPAKVKKKSPPAKVMKEEVLHDEQPPPKKRSRPASVKKEAVCDKNKAMDAEPTAQASSSVRTLRPRQSAVEPTPTATEKPTAQASSSVRTLRQRQSAVEPTPTATEKPTAQASSAVETPPQKQSSVEPTPTPTKEPTCQPSSAVETPPQKQSAVEQEPRSQPVSEPRYALRERKQAPLIPESSDGESSIPKSVDGQSSIPESVDGKSSIPKSVDGQSIPESSDGEFSPSPSSRQPVLRPALPRAKEPRHLPTPSPKERLRDPEFDSAEPQGQAIPTEHVLAPVNPTIPAVPGQPSVSPPVPCLPTPSSTPVARSLGQTGSAVVETSQITPPPPPRLFPALGNGHQDSQNSGPTSQEAEDRYRKWEALSKALFSPGRFPLSKPEPSGAPEVWANTRQELCETLHYFRGYHGAGYTNGGFAWGFMFDKSAHVRDYTDSQVVLCRAGGGMVKDKDSGEMVLAADRSENSQANSLRNCMSNYNPVVIISGADNPTFPSKPPHTYSVMDYFKPTHIWSEKTKGKTMVRYRFEKLNSNKPSWWQARGSSPPVALGELEPPVKRTCGACLQVSEQVYLQGWMCLQGSCALFWKLDNGTREPDEDELLYDPCFLRQKNEWPNDDHTYPLTSNNVELSGHEIPGEDCSRAYWAGMVCPDCGYCVLRLSWTRWKCRCGFTKEPPHILIPATALRDPYFPLSPGYSLSRNVHRPSVKLDVQFKHNYRINIYRLPGIIGYVAHLIANKPVVEEPNGPDAMFEELQKHDIGLERRSLGTGLIKGDSFTRHFSVNYGMPYKFIAATASRSFDGAAWPITATRTRLNWASKMMDEDAHQEFNEVLALGYFEHQKINYHDDGEFGLGPTIATLSLGAPGSMRLRMKAKHHNGVSAQGIYTDTLPMPGCVKYAQRLALAPELAALKASSPGRDYRARLKEIPKELDLKASGYAKDDITIALNHGDIVIMHGAEIQKYYEHAVNHSGKLRFALTCRYIDPESLKEADRPQYKVEEDKDVYHGETVGIAGQDVVQTETIQQMGPAPHEQPALQTSTVQKEESVSPQMNGAQQVDTMQVDPLLQTPAVPKDEPFSQMDGVQTEPLAEESHNIDTVLNANHLPQIDPLLQTPAVPKDEPFSQMDGVQTEPLAEESHNIDTVLNANHLPQMEAGLKTEPTIQIDPVEPTDAVQPMDPVEPTAPLENNPVQELEADQQMEGV